MQLIDTTLADLIRKEKSQYKNKEWKCAVQVPN